MPELPEVESFRRYLEDTSMDKSIIDVKVEREKILQEISIDEFIDNLICHRFVKTLRWGKQLFVQTDGGVWLTIHFGMTGSLFFFHQLTQKPSHCRLLITFCDNDYLCFDDQRLFGRVGIVQDVDSFIKKHQLGPDVLTLNKQRFVSIVQNQKTSIKTVLMKQELFAGIGNEYSDEILFQARINPSVLASSLSDEQIEKIFQKMSFVLATATESRVKDHPFPKHFLLHSGRKSKICPRCGSKLKCQKFSGRTGCFCPSCQEN